MISTITTDEGEMLVERTGNCVFVDAEAFNFTDATDPVRLFRAVKRVINLAVEEAQERTVRRLLDSEDADLFMEAYNKQKGLLNGTE